MKEIPIPGAASSAVGVPGGKYAALLLYDQGVTNIWLQPLDGRPPKQWSQFQLNHQTSNGIHNLAWAPDGKHMALTRSSIRGDVVLLKDQK